MKLNNYVLFAHRWLLSIMLYIVGPAPKIIWCTCRYYYRNIGTYLLRGSVDDYLPEPYILPPRHDSSLIGDIINGHHNNMAEGTEMIRNIILMIHSYIRSPVTYDYCPGDPGYFDRLILFIQITTGISLVVLTWMVVSRVLNYPYRYAASLLLWMSNSISVNNSFYRSIFNNSTPPKPIPMLGHSHPNSAAQRNADSLYCRQIALASGCEPYFVQCSAPDQRNGLRGSREYYWGKDTQQQPRRDPIPENAMLCFVDVDQYIDMPYLLANNDRPVAIATVQPTACANSGGEASFFFDEQSNLHYFVSGGADYVHPVWDYHTDSITCCAKWYGLPYATTVYNVDRRTTTDHHDVIFLTPSAKWGIFATLANWLLSYRPLKRYDLMRGTHLRMLVKTKTGMSISTAFPGQFAVATIPAELDNTISNLSVVAKSGLTRAAIETHLQQATNPTESAKNRETATILYDYYMHNSQKLSVTDYAASLLKRLTGGALLQRRPTVTAPCTNVPEVRRYQFGPYDVEAKPNMKAYMKPIIDAAFAPDKTKGNEERAKDKRITSVQNDAGLTPFLTVCIKEFIDLLIPIPHELHPVSHEEVAEKQNRPSQRIHLEEADITGNPKRIGKSFIKAEAYPDAKDPRLITTFNSKDKVEYSRYVYAITAWLKSVPGYAFGKTPNETARAVADTCSNATTITKTDFSRFDGHQSPVCRALEEAILYRLFNPTYHPVLQDLHRAHYNLFVVCVLGVSYQLKTSRGSGEAGTSTFNTLINMFATFVGHRMSPGSTTKFMDAIDAYRRTMSGIYGGDDGLSPDCNTEMYIKACSTLGLKVKAEELPRGSRGIEFLARVYGPDVWYGDAANCCNILRQLSKIHTSTMRPAGVTDEQMLIDKMAGYAITDANTPVIGTLAQKVMLLAKPTGYTPNLEHASWIAQTHDPSEIFNNPPTYWYEEYARESMPEFNFDKFYEWITTASTLQHILDAPLCMPWKTPALTDAPMVVDGELYPPITPTIDNKEKPKSTATTRTPIRKRDDGRPRERAGPRKVAKSDKREVNPKPRRTKHE